MWFIGYLFLGLFITMHIAMVSGLRSWMLKPHPDFPKDFPLPGSVHLVIGIISASISAVVIWIVVNI